MKSTGILFVFFFLDFVDSTVKFLKRVFVLYPTSLQYVNHSTPVGRTKEDIEYGQCGTTTITEGSTDHG